MALLPDKSSRNKLRVPAQRRNLTQHHACNDSPSDRLRPSKPRHLIGAFAAPFHRFVGHRLQALAAFAVVLHRRVEGDDEGPGIGGGGEREGREGEVDQGGSGDLRSGEVVVMAEVEGEMVSMISVHVLQGRLGMEAKERDYEDLADTGTSRGIGVRGGSGHGEDEGCGGR